MSALMEPARRLAREDKEFLGAIDFLEDDLREGKWSVDRVDLSGAPRISPADWPAMRDVATGFIEQRLGRAMRYPINGNSYVSMCENDVWEDSRLTATPEPGRVYYIPASLVEMSGLRKTVSLEPASPLTTPEATAWVLKVPSSGLTEGWRGQVLLMQALTWQRKKTDPETWRLTVARMRRTANEADAHAFGLALLNNELRLVSHVLPDGIIARNKRDKTPMLSIEVADALREQTVLEYEEAFGPPLSELELMGRKSAATWAAYALLVPSLRVPVEEVLGTRP